MKPAPFDYLAPRSIHEVISCLDQYGEDAVLLAGGQSLVPAMNFRLAQPRVLIDLNGVSELSYLETEGEEGLRLGAMTRQRELERSSLVQAQAPLVHEAMPYIAHSQIRNRGTVGGSIAQADPAAELPAVMMACRARFLLKSQRGERWVPARDFFTGILSTARESGELLVEAQIPRMAPDGGWAFQEIARRPGDYALVGVAVVLRADAGGQCRDARIVFLNAGDGPVEAHQAEAALEGCSMSAAEIEQASGLAAQQDIDPFEDVHATSEFRRHLARHLTTRALQTAWQRARSRGQAGSGSA